MAVQAGIYTRISKDTDDLREGVTRQQEDCLNAADERGWEVVETYCDNDTSAYNPKKVRPEFQRMISDFLAGNLDAIVVYDLDRFTRQTYELEALLHALKQKGGRRIADVVDEYDLSNGEHQDRLRFKAIQAQKESRDKSRRVTRGHLSRMRKGEPPHKNATKIRPFGYDFDHVTIRKDEAKLVRQAAERVLQGDSLSAICRDWEGKGVRTARGGTTWAYQSLRAILTAPRLAGLVLYQRKLRGEEGTLRPIEECILREPKSGDFVRGQWQPILDEETYFRVLRKLSDPSRRTNHVQGEGRKYLLTGGLAVCGACGERLVARPRDDHRCYGCRRKRRCGIRQTAAPFEDFVRDAVIEALNGEALDLALRKGSGREAEERELYEELRQVEQKILELDDLHFDGVLPKDRYLRQQKRQTTKAEDLRRRLSSNGHSRIVADLPRSADAIRRMWDARGLAWRRALVAAVIERVVLHPDPRRGQNGFDPSRIELIWRA